VTSRRRIVWRCGRCGCPEVEGTAWIVLNANRVTGSEPPDSDIWCPTCGEHYETSDLCSLAADGSCDNHRLSALDSEVAPWCQLSRTERRARA
jgi:hypothetical protein